MAEERKLKEYWIDISVQVEALDTEQAAEIGKDFISHGTSGSMWKIIGAEVTQIEEA